MLYSNTPNVLIKLTADDDFIAISTYCRKHGRKGRILFFKEWLQRIQDEDSSTLYDFHEHLIDAVECELSYVQQFEDYVERGTAGIRSTDDDAAM